MSNDLYKRALDMIDGAQDMDRPSAGLVRWAQDTFGNAGGDVARAFVQAPRTAYNGIKGGAVGANAGLNQLLADYTPIGAIPGVGDWLRGAAKQGYADANEMQKGATRNYQTAIGRDVGAGINSLGAQIPGVAATAATGNPAFMAGYAGGQTGLSSYNDARQAGVGAGASLLYGAGQGALETATEAVPAKAFSKLFGASGGGIGKGIARYMAAEQGGEQIATHGGDFLRSAVIDSRTNDNWLSDYEKGRLDAARSTAVGGLVAGVGNPAVGRLSVAARDAMSGGRGRKGPNLYQQAMELIDAQPVARPNPQAQQTLTSGAANQVNSFLRNNVANGGFRTRNDIPTATNTAQQNAKYRPVAPKTIQELTALSQNPNVRKMLNLISHTEGTEKHGYNTLVGGGRIDDLSRHPNKVGLVTGDGKSTAFGRYQITGTTYRGLQKKYGFTDMSPQTQDAAAVALMSQRGALNDVINGNYRAAISKLGDEWVSLPSSTNKNQGKRSWARVEKFLDGQGAQLGDSGQYSQTSGQYRFDDATPIVGMNQNAADLGAQQAAQQGDLTQTAQDALDEQAYQMRKLGRATRVFLDGKMQDAKLELVDADDISPTIAGAENQYRDRNRAASQIQVNEIANNLEPELLGDSKQIDTGAPTLAADGSTVIGGNGRLMAINQAYDQGNGDGYRQYLMDNAEQFGLSADDVAGMRKPVLVRRFTDNTLNTARAAVASNEGGGLGMSALEQARVDAERLPDMGTFVPSDNGELNTAANRGFIRNFVSAMPTNVQAMMVDAGGNLSQDGVRRLRNALLYSAYGDSPALSRMVGSTDSGMRNLVNAMIQSAPKIARAKNYIRDGAMHDADISADIVSAAETINQIHESGGSVADYLAQRGLLEDDLSPVARELVAFFDGHKRSAKAITTLLGNYYDALAAQGNPAEADIFGERAAPSSEQILNDTVNRYEQQNQPAASRQRDVFESAANEQQTEPTAEQRTESVAESVSRNQPESESGRSDATGAQENGRGTEQRYSRADERAGSEHATGVTDERIAELESAIADAVGGKAARQIDVVRLDDVARPDTAVDLVNAQGWYDTATKRITLIADNLPNAETAKFVAWHEMAHHGINVQGRAQWDGLMKQADGNSSVRKLADAVAKQRRENKDAAAKNRMSAVEEALAELYAAHKTDNLQALERKYDVSLPPSFKSGLSGFLSRVASRVKTVIQDALGLPRDTFSDGQVYDLLKRIDTGDTKTTADMRDDGTQDDIADDSSRPSETKFSRGTADMSKEERGVFNDMGELRVGLAAYNKLADVLKPLLARGGLANGYHENFTRYRRDYTASLNTAGRTAKAIAEEGKRLTADERKLLSDVLEKELPAGAEVSPELQELAATVRTIFNRQTDDLVALNMVSAESAERFRDTYLPRIYNKPDSLPENIDKMQKDFNRALRSGLGQAISGSHLKGRGIFKEVDRADIEKYQKQGFEVRQDYGDKGTKANKVLMWRDYTREERTKMGEERDAMLRFSVGYVQTQSDIAKGMLFKRIAADPNLASIDPVEGWIRVPDTTIAATGGVYRYGALAGMYAHPHVVKALESQFYVDGAMRKIWRSALGWWKITKTVYNPVAHVNNVISNIVMTSVAGATPKDMMDGARSLLKKDDLYNEALEHGLVGEEVDAAGIREMFVGLNNVADTQLTDTLITRALKRADKLTGRVVSRAGEVAEYAYHAEDEVFKLALYSRARKRGMSPKDATEFAYTFMFDYGDVPPTIRQVRDTGILPFISYSYKAVPAIARLALTQPHRLLSVTSMLYGLNALSYLMLGGDADEDEERKYMPEYQKGMTSFGTPKLIRLPWNDSEGKPMFVDVYRWLPLGDFADTQNQMGGVDMPQWMTPNGPVINHAFALIGNKDTFSGKEIVSNTQTTGEKAAVYGKWLAQQWLPSSVGVPFSYHTNNVLDGLKNQFEGTKFAEVLEDIGYTGTNARGEGRQLYRAALGSVGLKIRGDDPKELKNREARYIGFQMRELGSDIRRISRDKRLSPEARASKINSRREQMIELRKKLPSSSDNDVQFETD